MTEVGPKQPRIRDDKYLAFVRRQPCCVCWMVAPSDAAHIRMGSQVNRKTAAGMGEKPDDKWAVPLCRPVLGIRQGCHKSQHSMNEAEWWKSHGLDPFGIAKRLYATAVLAGESSPNSGKRKSRKTIIARGFGPSKRKLQSGGFK